MSNLIVPVTLVEKILPHPNADALELAHVLGWQLVVRKGEYTVGEKIVYMPPDTVLPLELSERFGVTKYLSKGRIRCAKLRGEPSFGLAVRPDNEQWEIGENVADYYGVSKWEPPLRPTAGDAIKDHPLFWSYTEIENMRNFPTVLNEGEEVVVLEKIHGTQCRLGMIEGELMAGSKGLRRKQPDDNLHTSIYWFPLTLEPVRALLEKLGQSHRQAQLFGEVYGSKIQSFHYGQTGGRLGFRAFDLLLDGQFMDWPELVELCQAERVETVPVVATIPFDLAEVKRYSEGKTLLMGGQPQHIREGVVVKPLHERSDPRIGRVILKFISDDFLLAKKSDFAEV